MDNLPRAEPKDWEEALDMLDFPASLSEIMKKARDRGGLDHEVHELIGRLGRDAYDTREQFVDEIRRLYLGDGVSPDKLPL
jgi:hypothetical protein